MKVLSEIRRKGEENSLSAERVKIKKPLFDFPKGNFGIQVNLVIRGLFIYEFAFSHWKHWSKISSQNESFYLRIQYSRSKKRDLSTTNNEAHKYIESLGFILNL